MSSPRIPLKDPVFAAVLGFLVPGLGHLYQRRIFKGVLYSVCILGTFFTGMRIGHGQVVYFNWQSTENRTYAYLCQFWVGLPALPALAQAHLRSPHSFQTNLVPEPLEARFEGELRADREGERGVVEGTVILRPQQPANPRLWSGELKGTLRTPEGMQEIEGHIAPNFLDAPVGPSRRRDLSGTFEGQLVGKPQEQVRGALDGSIPRSLWNSYEVPLQDTRTSDNAGESSELDRAHRELGSRFELGVVFTMIAGLLNILAIYDAFEGPAYEDDEEEPHPSSTPPVPAAA